MPDVSDGNGDRMIAGQSMRHHLVVLREEYLSSILAGRKTVECRISTIRRPPYEAVSSGDLLWFKLPSREIRAIATVGRCLFRELRTPADLQALLDAYADEIRASEAFFEGAGQWARFASLIWIETVIAIGAMPIQKSDQRAWVVLDRMPSPGSRIGRAAGSIRVPT